MVSDFLYSNFRELEICENLVILITLHSLVFQKIRELVGEIKYAYRICGLITLFMWALLYDLVLHQFPHFTSPQWESFVAYIPTVFSTNSRYYTGTKAGSIHNFPIRYIFDSHPSRFNLIRFLTFILISSVFDSFSIWHSIVSILMQTMQSQLGCMYVFCILVLHCIVVLPSLNSNSTCQN